LRAADALVSMQDNALGRRLRELREASIASEPESPAVEEAGSPLPPPRKPLGELLVSRGLVSETTLEAALAEQRSSGQPLGHILLASGAVTPQSLARAVTEQHGFDASGSLRGRLASDGAGESFLLIEAGDPEPLFVAGSFLDAADAAFELIEQGEDGRLAIVRDSDGERECVWSYSPEPSTELIGHGAEDHARFEEQ
jgi:hypothetical protein